MPVADRAALEQAVLPAMSADSAFETAPVWDGVPVETGALARMHEHPAVAALARAAATRCRRGCLRDWSSSPCCSASSTERPATMACIDSFARGEGEGVAAVQTARGLLLHRARIAEGRVAAYRIVAPTEWNFHPEGPLARGLAGMIADDEPALERGATLACRRSTLASRARSR